MEITVRVNIPDYVYQFYAKASAFAQRTPEEVMAKALYLYAEAVSISMLHDMGHPLADTAPPHTQ